MRFARFYGKFNVGLGAKHCTDRPENHLRQRLVASDSHTCSRALVLQPKVVIGCGLAEAVELFVHTVTGYQFFSVCEYEK